MSVFTEGEISYLNGQKLGRVATIDRKGELHVVPVSFRYNAETDTVDIGGYNMGRSKKFRDAAATGRVAFVVDDSCHRRSHVASKCVDARKRSSAAVRL